VGSASRFLLTLAGCAVLFAFAASVQAQAIAPVCSPVLDAHEFVDAWTAAVIGPANRDRTCFRQLLTADARLTGAVPGKDGYPSLVVESPEEFIAWYQKHGTETFWERTLHSTVDVYDNVARVTRTYEVRPSPAGPIQSRGIEDFQLVFDGHSWRCFAMLWQDKVSGEPLPPKYQP
jgi:hypothetical protein